jgi:hypothetical protein
MADYDRRALARAYADVRHDGSPAGGYQAAMRVHHQQILSGLQDLFGVTLEPTIPAEHRPLFVLFESTIASLDAARTPWDDHPEAGLIHQRLEETGQSQAIAAASDRIKDLVAQSREAHLDILTAVLEPILGDRATKVFTSADLRNIGIDDTPPNSTDYGTDWETY